MIEFLGGGAQHLQSCRRLAFFGTPLDVIAPAAEVPAAS